MIVQHVGHLPCIQPNMVQFPTSYIVSCATNVLSYVLFRKNEYSVRIVPYYMILFITEPTSHDKDKQIYFNVLKNLKQVSSYFTITQTSRSFVLHLTDLYSNPGTQVPPGMNFECRTRSSP